MWKWLEISVLRFIMIILTLINIILYGKHHNIVIMILEFIAIIQHLILYCQLGNIYLFEAFGEVIIKWVTLQVWIVDIGFLKDNPCIGQWILQIQLHVIHFIFLLLVQYFDILLCNFELPQKAIYPRLWLFIHSFFVK